MYTRTLFCTFAAALLGGVYGVSSYAGDFVNPDKILAGNFPDTTKYAQKTVVQWAQDYASAGPWATTDKDATPPSGDKKDYMSWAPYSWPNCTSAGNTTELQPEQIWTTCEYYTRDGIFNDDARTVINDIGNFNNLSDAVLYTAMSWVVTGDKTYAEQAASFINTWFVNSETAMNPNLNYAQMSRGPGDGQLGQHTGVLDLKGLVKITSGLLILRNGKSEYWTDDLNNGFVSWANKYIEWLETAQLALDEGWADNNHGSFYYNQLAALYLITDDKEGAYNVTNSYFNLQYKTQIEADGEQPLEAIRTRPYHYRAYNAAAMVTSARIQAYAKPDSPAWGITSNSGATIQTAVNFAMTIDPAATGEEKYAAEIYPMVAAVAVEYGDSDGKYATFLKEKAGEKDYISEAWFLWDQPLAGGESFVASAPALPSATSNPNVATDSDGDAAFILLAGRWFLGSVGIVLVAVMAL